MNKIGTIIGGGVAAIALAAAVGISGVFSGQAFAAEKTQADTARTTEADSYKSARHADKVEAKNIANLTEDQHKALKSEMQTKMKAALSDLVAKGTITRETADLLLPKDGTVTGEKPNKSDRAKIDLTDAQKTAIGEAMKNAYKSAVDSLASAGTITKEQADTLANASAGMVFKLGHHEKVNLTDDQRKALETAAKKQIDSAFAGLVANGTFTQAEADALKPASGTSSETGKLENWTERANLKMTDAQAKALKEAMQKANEAAIAELVSNKTLTQETADKLKSGGMMKHSQMKDGAVLDKLTQTQRDAVQSAIKSATKTALDGLVSKGTITRETADAMQKKFGMKPDTSEKPGDATGAREFTKIEITKEQMEAIRTATKDACKTALAGLVKNGTISQETADNLADSPMICGPGKFGGNINHDTPGFGMKEHAKNRTEAE